MENNVSLQRTIITTGRTVKLNGVVSVDVQNYDTGNLCIINLSGIKTEIPPTSKVNGVDVPSRPYRINAYGKVFSEVVFDIEFPTGSGKVILDIVSTKCN